MVSVGTAVNNQSSKGEIIVSKHKQAGTAVTSVEPTFTPHNGHQQSARQPRNGHTVAPEGKYPYGQEELIARLNVALSFEYAATIQYLNQHCVVRGRDRQDYAPFFAESSNESHLHAQNLGNKIAALGGVPTIEPARVRAAAELGQMLRDDLTMEREALEAYIKAWEAAAGDHPLQFWLENIIQEEQLHVDELEKLTAERT
jgi:bacterioferritin